jgi:hypothetical protein
MSDIRAICEYGINNYVMLKINYFCLDINYDSGFIFSTPNSELPIFHREEDNDGANYNVSNNSWWIQFDSDGQNKSDLSCTSIGGKDYTLNYYNYSNRSNIELKLSADDNSVLYSKIIEMIEELNDLMVDMESRILNCRPCAISYSVNSKKTTF